MKATLERIEDISHSVKTFWFKPQQKILYTPGQFTEIRLLHDNPDERGEKRWFTLSSSPTEDLLSITTKFSFETGSTFKQALLKLQPGTELELAEPMGDFVLPKDTAIPLAFVAGGMGLTPFRSIVKWLIDAKEERQVEIVLGFNREEDIIFEGLFREYGAPVQIVLSEPSSSWQGSIGHLSAAQILSLVENIQTKRLYVSGPEPMVENIEKDLLASGIEKNNLVLGFFPGYKPI